MAEAGLVRFSIVTLFPEMFESVLATSILGKARAAGHVSVDFIDPRQFATDRHRSVDDAPYGGGPGMVMQCGPLLQAIERLDASAHKIFLAPTGAPLSQEHVQKLATLEHVALVCGRYEGVDERVIELAIDECISIGDYVLTGGELGAMVVIDAVARYVPGVLGEPMSTSDESFSAGLLEYPQYTRPPEVRGLSVPEILFSGHHARIAEWRRRQAIERTARHRPELLGRRRDLVGKLAARTYVVLAHHPVLDRTGQEVTSSVTNFDIHDIARSAATYGLAGYLPVSPVTVQRQKIERIVEIWRHELEQIETANRAQALATIATQDSIESALAYVRSLTGQDPFVVATSARPSTSTVGFGELRAQRIADEERPVVLLFGTGWGLADSVFTLAHQTLAPISGTSEFNHLSVRSAVAVILDRLFGAEGQAAGV